MNGLLAHERDPDLPARAGDTQLRVPPAASVLERINADLRAPGGAEATRADLEYARWKPGTSLTCTFGVTLADESRELVVYKRYVANKADHVAKHYTPSEHVFDPDSALRPSAVDTASGICLYCFPADRVLRGAARVLNKRRTARSIDQSGCFAPFVVRLRASSCRLVRFKPERRAVFRFDAKLRGPDERRDAAALGIRALPPALGAAVADRRRRHAASTTAVHPELLDCEGAAGILIEQWLAGDPVKRDDFRLARAAGAALAQFHTPADADPRQRVRTPRAALLELFRIEPRLVALAESIGEPVSRAPNVWIHGDFHPDQLLVQPSREVAIVDLDNLRPGRAAEDLASWVGDHLAERDHVEFDEAARELLDGYGHEREEVERVELAEHTVAQLVQRAAAALRRLERDATGKALRLLERARDLDQRARGWR